MAAAAHPLACAHGVRSPCVWCAAADRLDPPPLPPALRSPVAFAEQYSRGQWRRARHLEVIEAAVLEAIATAGRLIISVSVRHGKSAFISRWLPAWFIGANPDKRVLLWCHEADFAASHGRAARDILMEHGPDVFGVQVSRRSEAASRWDLVAPHVGGMVTFGVGGSPLGRGGDLIVGDDPLKNFAAAMSPLQRARVHEHYTGTIVSRAEPGAAVVIVEARWHEDDLSGFLQREQPDEWRVVRMPAICDDPANDPLGRDLGEPLWPERFPLAELERRHRETALKLGEVVWLAQYQQRPTAPGGDVFPESLWGFIAPHDVPDGLRWVRAWDLAATKDGGDWTVGARMARLPDGRFVVDDVRRGQWDSRDVRAEIARAAAADPPGTPIELPQDPGQAGKDQSQQLVSMLAGHIVHARPQTGSKEVRAAGYAAQQKAGNMLLVEGRWNGAWVSEHASFPRGSHDDQVDAAAAAFNRFAGSPAGPATGKSPAGRRTAKGSELARRQGGRLTK